MKAIAIEFVTINGELEPHITVDKSPWEHVQFDTVEMEHGGTLYYGTLNGYARFAIFNDKGLQGAYTGQYRMTDGTVRTLNGGWSSRPSIVYRYTGLEIVHVGIKDLDDKYGYCGGNVTVAWLVQSLKDLDMWDEYRIVTKDFYGEVVFKVERR